MCVFVAEPLDFVLDARAVPGPQPLDAAVEHGRSVKSFAQQVVDTRVGVGDVATALVLEQRGFGVREALRIVIAFLLLHDRVVYASAVHTRRGSCFHSVSTEAVFHQLLSNATYGLLTSAPTAKLLLTDVHEAVEECACSHDDRTGTNGGAQLGLHTHTRSVFDQQFDHSVLPKIKFRRLFQH